MNTNLTSKNISGKKVYPSKQRVYVGMSGGVDSSVSAALLKDSGFDVTGVFVKVWQADFLPCSWKEERRDAMRVAAHLDIPFITLDLEKEYKKEVVDYMIDEYKKGRTPNPDVMCNKHVKFGGFYDFAMEQGADYIATGHYQDGEKDQRYFLWTLTEMQLAKTLFPVGKMEKPEVRRLAKKFKLPNAEKKDSQGLCFMGKVDIKEFLKHFIEEKPGDVLNEKAEIIGTHNGALFYTLGERHGFTITKKTPEDKPYFVVAKDVEKNTITVFDTPFFRKGDKGDLIIINTNLRFEVDPTKTYQAQIRYRGKFHDIHIEVLNGNQAKINFTQETENVAPGQSIVIYDEEKCLGGGIVV